MHDTALETPPQERVYTPASVSEAYKKFPAVGSTITISYRCEYMGSTGRNSDAKKRVMQAEVVQKAPKIFVVETIPKNKEGMRGRYRVAFSYVDLITGKVRIAGVD